MAPLPPWITPYTDQYNNGGSSIPGAGGSLLTSQYGYTPMPTPTVPSATVPPVIPGQEFGSTFARSPVATPGATPAWMAGGGGAGAPGAAVGPAAAASAAKIYAGLKPNEMNAEQLAAFYKDNQPSQIPGYVSLGLQGLQGLGNLYFGYQAMKQADQQFGLQSKVANTNLAAQLASYNTSMEDKIRGRYSATERNSAEGQAKIQAEIDRRKVTEQK